MCLKAASPEIDRGASVAFSRVRQPDVGKKTFLPKSLVQQLEISPSPARQREGRPFGRSLSLPEHKRP